MMRDSIVRLSMLVAFILHVTTVLCFQNPVRRSGPDPSIVYANGNYHLTYTSGDHIEIAHSPTLKGLWTGWTRTVWRDSDPSRNANMWAPEMHRIDGTWYMFYSSCDSRQPCCDSCRTRVLQGCNGPDPSSCNYRYLADLTPPDGWRGGRDGRDGFSIDGSFLEIPGRGRYHVLSVRNDLGGQAVAITRLDTRNWTVGRWHIILHPDQGWHQHTTNGMYGIVEAPHPLYHNGEVWLAYSGSACQTPDYGIGFLHYRGGNPLSPYSWQDYGQALWKQNGHYGTGHNCFFKSPDGRETWTAYHATDHPEGYCGPDRYTMTSRVRFDRGVPRLELPRPRGSTYRPPSGE